MVHVSLLPDLKNGPHVFFEGRLAKLNGIELHLKLFVDIDVVYDTRGHGKGSAPLKHVQ